MSNTDTLNNFFKVLNDPAFANFHNVQHLMGHVFCANDTQRKTPCVGITDHGPQYVGTAQVAELFDQLFTTFPDLALTPVSGAPLLHSPTDYPHKTIGIQTTLTGHHLAEWFPRGHRFFSPPLSDIHPDKVHHMKIPACAVFTFDDGHRICQLAIYLDRYRMMQQLTPATSTASSTGSGAYAGKRITITIE
jgi:hypothetical protein